MSRSTAPTAVLPAASTGTTGALAKPQRRRLGITIAIIAVAVVVIGAGLYKLFNRSQPRKAISFASAKITRLTTTGKATRVAISPDGKYVVHVEDDGGQQRLWTRQVATQSNVEIVAPAAVTYESLTFSPDGDYIYYSISSQNIPQGGLFQVPTLGGAPKKVLVNLDSRDTISFSPDGKQFAFIRDDVGKEFALLVANADGTGERKLVAHKNPPESIGYPTWSPDGKSLTADSNTLAVVKRETQANVWIAPTGDANRARPVTAGSGKNDTELTFAPDGTKIIYKSNASGDDDIWIVNADGGNRKQLTANARVNGYSSV